MIAFTIYVVDDEESILKGVSTGLKRDYRVRGFSSAEAAIEGLKRETPDLILLDIGLPGMSGMEALKRIKETHPEILVVMVTAYEEIQTVISAMKAGAHDYIVKPLHMDTLRLTVKNALETLRMRKEIQSLQERFLRENLPCFVGESDVITEVIAFIEKVAKSKETPVLVLGESGTGKELIAHAIHDRSPLYQGPFVPVNCAAIPGGLLESELFGYEKGAFTGARGSGKRGMVDEATGGTLFLDEVGALSLEAQAKLLRFLEQGEYYRLGSTRKRKARVRVISATNQDLMGMIEKDLFREDFYYRLAVVKVAVPSLNGRREDIPLIARHFLEELGRRHGKHFSGISPEAEEVLKDHHWRGNVRELKNVIERGVLMGNGPLLMPSDLGMEKPLKGAPPHPPLPETGIDLSSLEEHYIHEALKMTRGNAKEAARLLGMTYYAFRYRMKKLRGSGTV
ncbi:MAG: sigma-54-dependent Fis family transcriptional regulator [Deltaproteobacteria bacterium]|nr:sigma-54-dependent Fis family transcriptional regulator [Deltaproteobacteria bacterium]